MHDLALLHGFLCTYYREFTAQKVASNYTKCALEVTLMTPSVGQ